MPRKKRKSKKLEDVYTLLSIKVDDFKVSSRASQNAALRTRDPWMSEEDDLAYEFETNLTILGTCIYPDERAEDGYEVTLLGGEPHAGQFSASLKDFQARNEYGSPVYRQYRGREVPVYEAPLGIGVLNKVRGEKLWTAWLHVAPSLVSDMLVQLALVSSLYLSIDEIKVDRNRWIRSISLQNTDPAKE